MAATLSTPPPALALAGDGIYVEMTSDLVTDDKSYFEIEIADGGPADDQELTLTWPDSGSVTYTTSAAADGSPELWPLQGGSETLVDYADRIADFLRDGGLLTGVFEVLRQGTGGTGELIWLRHVVAGTFDLVVETNELSNVTVTPTNVTSDAAPAGLRAVVEVLAQATDDDFPTSLLTTHATFGNDGAVLDIHAAFDHLALTLPSTATTSLVLPTATPPAFYSEECTNTFQRYLIRWGERWGLPALLGNLVRSDDHFHVIKGIHAGAAKNPAGVQLLCHDYNRRDGVTFRKPISVEQPDWFYWWSGQVADLTELSLTCKLYWSDGSNSTYTPFASGIPIVNVDRLYVFSAGYRQLRLHLATPPGAGVYIVGYDIQLGPQTDDLAWQAVVRYDIAPVCHPWNMYILFENGIGGMETAWLRGKASEKYPVDATEYQIPRWFNARPAETGDYRNYDAKGRVEWEVSTGWQEDTFYLEHLKQLPLARCWLIDLVEGRFLSVKVEPSSSPYRSDDETIHELSFKVVANWYDDAFNL